MAKVTTPANPLPPWVNFIKDPATLTGTETNRPFSFSKDEMFYYWWKVKNLITSDGNVSESYASETDLICKPVVFGIGIDEYGVLEFELNLYDVYLDDDGQYWPYINAYYGANNGVKFYTIGMASEGYPPNANSYWGPVLRGTVTILDKGSANLWLSMPEYLNPEDCPFSASGSVSINDYWSYS